MDRQPEVTAVALIGGESRKVVNQTEFQMIGNKESIEPVAQGEGIQPINIIQPIQKGKGK